MSHIHLPDGILPISWWLTGFVLTFIILYFLLSQLDRFEVQSRIPRAAMASAFMLIAMSVPLGVIPLHLSMAVLTGILVGPGLGFLAVFVVNLVLAFVGHGGLTIVGLNTLIIGSEVIIGSMLFHKLVNISSVQKAAFLSVFPALIVSVSLMVGVVSANVGWAEAVPVHNHDHAHSCNHEEEHNHHEHGHQQDNHDHKEPAHEDDALVQDDEYREQENHKYGTHHEDLESVLSHVHLFTLTGWTALGAILIVGVTLESGVTALIVKYIHNIKPDFIHKGTNYKR